jgi:hypothetical protein
VVVHKSPVNGPTDVDDIISGKHPSPYLTAPPKFAQALAEHKSSKTTLGLENSKTSSKTAGASTPDRSPRLTAPPKSAQALAELKSPETTLGLENSKTSSKTPGADRFTTAVITEVNNNSLNSLGLQFELKLYLPPDDVTRSLKARCNELYAALKRHCDRWKYGIIQLSACPSITLAYQDVLNFSEPRWYTNGNLAILEPALQLPKDSIYVVAGCESF